GAATAGAAGHDDDNRRDRGRRRRVAAAHVQGPASDGRAGRHPGTCAQRSADRHECIGQSDKLRARREIRQRGLCAIRAWAHVVHSKALRFKKMKAAVVVFPGINRERDMARTLRLVSGREPAMVWHAETSLPAGTDLVVIPGGFSYGDYLRCGAIAARAPIMDAVRAHAEKGGLVLAVCNGFQIACEAGLLPGVLMRNAQLRFICHDVYLRVERSDTPF